MDAETIWNRLTDEERELLRDNDDDFVPMALVPRLQALGAIPDGPTLSPAAIKSRRVETADGVRYQLAPELQAHVDRASPDDV